MPIREWIKCRIFSQHEWDKGTQGWFHSAKSHRDPRQVFPGTLFKCRRCGAERFEWASKGSKQ